MTPVERRPGGPVPGAIAVLLHRGRVLLVQRGKAPDRGLWGFPGGHVERGESAEQAAVRELLEETGVRARAVGHLTEIDVLRHDAKGRVIADFRLTAIRCAYLSGTARAADDAADARWVPVREVLAGHLPMSAQVAEVTLMVARQGA